MFLTSFIVGSLQMFSGLFDRGELYDNQPCIIDAKQSQDETKYRNSFSSDASFKEQYADMFVKNSNQTKESVMHDMEEAAKKFGVDLNDPLVQQELRRLDEMKKSRNAADGKKKSADTKTGASAEDEHPKLQNFYNKYFKYFNMQTFLLSAVLVFLNMAWFYFTERMEPRSEL